MGHGNSHSSKQAREEEPFPALEKAFPEFCGEEIGGRDYYDEEEQYTSSQADLEFRYQPERCQRQETEDNTESEHNHEPESYR